MTVTVDSRFRGNDITTVIPNLIGDPDSFYSSLILKEREYTLVSVSSTELQKILPGFPLSRE